MWSVSDRGLDLVWRSSLRQVEHANCPLYVYFRALGRCLRFCLSAGQRPGSRLEILPQASQACKLSSLRVLPCTWERFTILFQCWTEAWISFGDPFSGKSVVQIVLFTCTSVHLGDVYDSVSVLDRGLDLVWRSSLRQVRHANCLLCVYFRALGRRLRLCFVLDRGLNLV